MAQSSIEWTELTWNPTTGCTKISQGCKFCYAEVMTRRLKAMGIEKYLDGPKDSFGGVSVEDKKVIDRIDLLRKTNARVKFLSCEPLIAPLENINLKKIDWVIVGGESGHNPRPMKADCPKDSFGGLLIYRSSVQNPK